MTQHVCPFWIGYLLACPLRRLVQKPEAILEDCVTPGAVVLDLGCAMGFFSIPMARMVGPQGKVICVDVQEKMLHSLEKRALQAALRERIVPCLVQTDSFGFAGYEGKIDFVLAFAVVHEVTNKKGLFESLGAAMSPAGTLLFAEPKGHVKQHEFDQSLGLAQSVGFRLVEKPSIRRSHSALLTKTK